MKFLKAVIRCILQEYFPFKNPAVLFWQLLSTLVVSFKICVTLAVLEQSVEKGKQNSFFNIKNDISFSMNLGNEDKNNCILLLCFSYVHFLFCFCGFWRSLTLLLFLSLLMATFVLGKVKNVFTTADAKLEFILDVMFRQM